MNIASPSFWIPDYLPQSAWQAHAPFAFWLTQAIEPRRFVELGTHSGMSFFAFCQAIQRLGLQTSAIAIDTWKGDPQAGLYDEGVDRQIVARIDRYSGFASLVRCTFDDAVSRFDDGSIDLLHIDGLHDCDDLRHDFETWRPKLTDEAVVLFHDTQERTRGFGVWRLFKELSADRPSFRFEHGHGLGVLCPTGVVPEGLRSLMKADAAGIEETRGAYATLGAAIEERWRSAALRDGLGSLLMPDADLSSDGLASLAEQVQAPVLMRLGGMLAAARCGPSIAASAGARHERPTDRRSDEATPAGRSSAPMPSPDKASPIPFKDSGSDATIALLRRSLMARRQEVDRLRRVLEGTETRAGLLRAAYRGLTERGERDRLCAASRHAELIRWGQGRKARLDVLTGRLDAEMRARSEAEARFHDAERSRLVRVARRIQRLLGRQPRLTSTAVPDQDRQARIASDIRDTGLFDEAYYRDSNPDLDAVDPTLHFAETGWWEGRRPNPTFDPVYYLATNDDVRTTGQNPLIHYAEWGIVEGRLPSHVSVARRWFHAADEPLSAEQEAAVSAVIDTALFDDAFYRSAYPDIVDGGVDPVVHYALEGWREGRRPNAEFDPTFYREAYGDVGTSGLDPLVHYATVGIMEGRLPSREAGPPLRDDRPAGDSDRRLALSILETGLFDTAFYLASNPDLAGIGPDAVLHYVRHGFREGRWPNPYFDPKYYLDHNPDVLALGIDPLLHFADHGIFEGQPPVVAPPPVDGVSESDYTRWVAAHDTLTEADRRAIRARLRRLDYKPLISVILPVYDTPIPFLRQAIGSVQSQIYDHWELCIADDASPNPAVRHALRELARSDRRIKLVERLENGHISAASNSAVAVAEGEFLALLDHDDIIPDHALFEVVACLNRQRDLDLIYSDEDHLDRNGQRTSPYFKSDFNPELMLGHNMISHLGVYRTEIVRAVGGFRLGYEGSQDYDLALRVIDATTPSKIRHIPAILYHWRSADGSATFSQTYQDRCIVSARQALAEHLERRGQAGEVVAHPLISTWHRVKRPVPDPAPLVSIIVPTKNKAEILGPCCEGILRRTDYANIELIIVDHQSTEAETVALLARLAEDERVRILPHEGVFNYSAINNAAARQAKGSVLAFLNNDVEVIAPEWLSEMVALACRPDVGAVGAKLLYPDGRVQHAGVVLGAGGIAGHAFHLVGADDPGDMGRAILTMAVSAVTAACLVVKRSIFDAVGGFDADDLPVAFNDVDLCLKIRDSGVRNVFTPHALLYHHESLSRGSDQTGENHARFKGECDFMIEKWGDILTSDPFYNPNLDLTSANFGLAWPPQRVRPWMTAP